MGAACLVEPTAIDHHLDERSAALATRCWRLIRHMERALIDGMPSAADTG
jgi:hypothetical protein